MAAPDYKPLVDELKINFASGKTKDLKWRKQQLQAVQAMIAENHEEFTAALRADLGGPKIRGFMDQGCHIAATDALKNLDKWTAPQRVTTPFHTSPTCMGKSYIRQEAKGVVLIVGPWNFPLELVLSPLVAAIAAGNCVVVKPSEVAENCAAAVARLVSKYLDNSCIKVIQGAVAETTALLRESWDHIFYTGNGTVGKIVLKAAAEHFTPVTLELGGKSPVIVDKSATMQSVIERVSAFKYSVNSGQICVAPDYIVIHKDREEEFIEGMKKHILETFGKNPKESPYYGRIINARHVDRIQSLLRGTKGQIVAGSMEAIDPSSHYIPPTVVRNVQIGEPLLTEEIFGPVLPVVTVNSIEEAVQTVNTVCETPLALYVFSEDKSTTDYVLNNTKSGGGAINTCFEHIGNPYLPFGGVRASGYGASHGKFAFDEFTHRRSILHQDTTIMKGSALDPQPQDQQYDFFMKFLITGFNWKCLPCR